MAELKNLDFLFIFSMSETLHQIQQLKKEEKHGLNREKGDITRTENFAENQGKGPLRRG